MRAFLKIIVKAVLIIFFAGFSHFGFAQTMQHSVGLQVVGYANEGNIKALSPASGFFYSLKFNHRFGVDIATLYHQHRSEGISYSSFIENSPDPLFVKFTRHYFEIPVNVSLNLNKRPVASWKTAILAGGTYSYYLGWTEKDYSGNTVSSLNTLYSGGLIWGNLGVEVSHSFNGIYLLALNPGLRVGLFDAYPDSNIYFAVKFGRIL